MAEIKFKRDTAFRKQFFVPDSFAHPAKMDAQLLMWIVLKYTEAGKTILDPMAGSGTTMLACGVGRNAILVELEEKFCKMMTGYDCDGRIKGYKDVWVKLVEEGWLVYSGLECVEHLFKTYEEAKEFYETWEERGQPRDYGIRWQEGIEGHYEKEPIPADCGKKKNHKPHHVTGNWELVNWLKKNRGPQDTGFSFCLACEPSPTNSTI